MQQKSQNEQCCSDSESSFFENVLNEKERKIKRLTEELVTLKSIVNKFNHRYNRLEHRNDLLEKSVRILFKRVKYAQNVEPEEDREEILEVMSDNLLNNINEQANENIQQGDFSNLVKVRGENKNCQRPNVDATHESSFFKTAFAAQEKESKNSTHNCKHIHVLLKQTVACLQKEIENLQRQNMTLKSDVVKQGRENEQLRIKLLDHAEKKVEKGDKETQIDFYSQHERECEDALKFLIRENECMSSELQSAYQDIDKLEESIDTILRQGLARLNQVMKSNCKCHLNQFKNAESELFLKRFFDDFEKLWDNTLMHLREEIRETSHVKPLQEIYTAKLKNLKQLTVSKLEHQEEKLKNKMSSLQEICRNSLGRLSLIYCKGEEDVLGVLKKYIKNEKLVKK